MNQSRAKPDWQKRLAKERVASLFSQAEANPLRANRYAALALKVAMRYNVKSCYLNPY